MTFSLIALRKSALIASFAWGALTCGVIACGGSSSIDGPGETAGDAGTANASPTGSGGGDDASISAVDAGTSTPIDGGSAVDAGRRPPSQTIDASLPPDPNDGTPTPAACTTARGHGTSGAYGRIDGFLSSIRCGKIDDHLHLQVRMNGEIYDIAVNLDTLYAERDAPMPAATGAWAEGWHTTGIALDYPTAFGVHAADFTLPPSMPELALMLQQELVNANHISIYAQGYDSMDGAHDIHRRGKNIDGAIVIHPLADVPHVVLFRFSTDSF